MTRWCFKRGKATDSPGDACPTCASRFAVQPRGTRRRRTKADVSQSWIRRVRAHLPSAPRAEGQNGNPVFRSGSVLDRPRARIVKKAGIRSISLHSFRRKCENILRQAGVSDLVRKSIAGGRTDKGQAIYATVDRSERDLAAEVVTELATTCCNHRREEGGLARAFLMRTARHL
jgi:integrase